MQTFVWGKEFYTGIDIVDEQHHGLVDLFNGLSATLTERQRAATDEAAVQLAFERLIEYAQQHFGIEEGIMCETDVDPRHVAAHLKLHDEFIVQVRAMWGARASLVDPAEVFLSFLTSWLCLHVLGIDQSLARQIDAIGQGETPAQAYTLELERPCDNSAEAMIKALRNTYQVVSRLSFELIAANRSLEERVAQRTEELQHANEALVAANRQLETYSQTDGLLGIANRKYFDMRLQEEWQRAIRDEHPLGILMIDVDFFKSYNDRYGHPAGDRCLQAVVRAAGSRMVRANDLLARYGGEEFVVILPNTGLPGAHNVARGVCAAVAALSIEHSGSAVADHVTVSIGVAAIVPERQSTASQTLAAADRALYAAKQQGRNQVCLATT